MNNPGRSSVAAYRVKKMILGAENLAGCQERRRGGRYCDARVIMWEMYFKTKKSPFVWAALLARYRGVPEEQVVCGLDRHPS